MPLHDWTRVDPNTYHTFHQAWITALWHALNGGVLPAGYYAMTDQTTPPLKPDVLTLEAPNSNGGPIAGGNGTPYSPSAGSPAGTRTATQPPIQFTAVAKGRKPPKSQAQVRIRHNSNHRLVAVIEIASPANKANRRDFRQFIDKAVGLLNQEINLLVVDPFPPTARDPHGLHDAIWHALVRRHFLPPAERPLTLASYAAEGANYFGAYVEPIAVGDALPDMPLFLTPDVYVNVPLEPTYQAAWQGFPEPLRGVVEGTA